MRQHGFILVGISMALAALPAAAQDAAVDSPAQGGSTVAVETPSGLSAAGLVGNGFEDGVNLGVGARLGYTQSPLYFGGTFVYHFGESRKASAFGQSADVSVNIYYVGGELGYELPAGPLVLRPYLGAGIGTARGCLNDICDTESRAYVAPGAALLYPLSEQVFAGGDARYLVPLDDDGSDFDHFALFATVGGYF